MDWSKGYSASFYASFVDPVTWRDVERFEIKGGSISRSDADLQESADLDCVDYDQSRERWVRIWLDTKQGGASSHTALFTGLATSPDKDLHGFMSETKVELYSVLKPASDIYLQRGYYAPINTAGARVVADLLSVVPAPKEIAGDSPALQSAIIAEDGETRLTMAIKVLEAINWRITISGTGTIRIGPKPTEPVVSFDALENDCIEPEISVSYDWFSCPNIFRAITDGVSAVARDDDPNSPFSVASRGREVWQEEDDCDLAENETLAEYAKRRLKEEQNLATMLDYDRRYHPDVGVGDLIRLHYPGQGIDGIYEVTKQSITLGAGARTSEEVRSRGSIQ